MADGFLLYKTKGGKEVRSGSLKILLDFYQQKINAALEKHSQAATSAIIRVALQDAGEMWRNVFLPKRFSSYSKNLGYTANDSYNAMKVEAANAERPLYFKSERGISESQDLNSGIVIQPQPTPFVASGKSKETVLSSAYVDVKVTKTRGRVLIKCQTGVIRFTRQYEAFLTIPAIERQRVTEQVKKNLEAALLSTGPGKQYTDSFRWTSASQRSSSNTEERAV